MGRTRLNYIREDIQVFFLKNSTIYSISKKLLRIIHQCFQVFLRLNNKTIKRLLVALFESGTFERELKDMACKSEINEMLEINKWAVIPECKPKKIT